MEKTRQNAKVGRIAEAGQKCNDFGLVVASGSMAPAVSDMAREWPRTDIYKGFVANRHMSADQVMFKLYAERCRFCARRPMFQLCWKSPSVSVLSHVNGLLDGGATHRLRQYQRRERRSSSKIILETSTNWNAEFPSVNPNQDQQMHDFKEKIHKRGLKKINRKKSTRSE